MDEGKLEPLWYDDEQILEDLYYQENGGEGDGNDSGEAKDEGDNSEDKSEDDADAINAIDNE